jgi:mannonate dehydratase
MLRLAEILTPRPTPLWKLVRQCGVMDAVGVMDFAGYPPGGPEKPWGLPALRRLKEDCEREGFALAALESRPPLGRAKLGLLGGEEEIDSACDLIRAMGALGIPVWCYEWMALFNWQRTDKAIPARGGALVTGFDATKVEEAPPAEAAAATEERLWQTLEHFLRRALPVAEQAGVRLAMHPDDPPVSPIRGVGRIMRSVESFQRLLDMVPSPSNGIALCQGNFALMTEDVSAVIRRFGSQGKIFFVHLRDVRGTATRFVETFHDDGQTDMLECMKAYRDIGFDGVARPDHVPTMEGERNDSPGYQALGRLFALGYLRGLHHAVYGKPRP